MRLLPLLLVGCSNPISNRLFYEDASFLAALPSPDRFYAPEDVRLARVGSSAVLEGAVLAAAELEELTALISASGEALRSAVPVERSDAVRAWDPVSTGAKVGGISHVWFVRGSVLRPVEGGDLDWTIDVAVDPDGPWQLVGSGQHDPSGTGDATWDLGVHAALLGVDIAGVIEIAYDDLGTEGVAPLVEYGIDGLGLPRIWGVAAQGALTHTGTFAVGESGALLPGVAQVVHVPEQGGSAVGAVYEGESELLWEACWNADGDEVACAPHDPP